MKTTMTFLSIAVASLCVLNVSAQLPSGEINEQSLPVVPLADIPAFGTFWIDGPQGMLPPLPLLPPDLIDEPTYALDDGGFLVDARNLQTLNLALPVVLGSRSSFGANADFSPPLPGGGGSPGPFNPPHPTPAVIFSNAWFTEIVISNHTYISLSNATINGLTGSPMTTEFPVGMMFPVTSTNLSTPVAQWQPVGETNAIGNFAFEIPYNPASTPISFYRVCAQLDTNIPPQGVIPFSLLVTNLSILIDFGVTLTWTNGQPGLAAESDTVVKMDTNGHSYLVDSVITSGATGSLSFELQSTNGLTFVRYSTNAISPGDQFFLPTNNFNNPDIVTVPYLIDTTSGRAIIEVEAYDVTDPSNPQFLARIVDKGGAGAEAAYKGTLEIPGISLASGVETLEFRATDSNLGQTITDIAITNNRLVSIVSPVLAFEADGTNRTAASAGSYGVSFQAKTTATNGTWVVNIYNPAGTLVGTAAAAVTNIGQTIIFDDGSTESTLYPDPYYDVEVNVNPPGNQPPPVATKTIRVYLLPPRSNAGSIVGYDDTALPSSSADRQFVINTMANGLSQLFEFIYQIIDFGDGNWKTVSSPTAISLNSPPALNWGWRALQHGLASRSYDVTLPPSYSWVTQTPDRPILGVAVHGHGAIDPNAVAQGVQGPDGFNDTVVTQESLEGKGFVKSSNAVAIAVLTGCKIGAGPFMQFVLRNNDVGGQISDAAATAGKIRPCFGIAWTQNLQISAEADQFGWISYWTLYAGAFGGNGTPFLYTLDNAFTLAQQNYSGNGGNYAVWSGTAGRTLDRFAH